MTFGSPKRQSTLRRAYTAYQVKQGFSKRCEIDGCPLGSAVEPAWNGAPLTLILDHINGDKKNSHPTNLRWVCPNCASQLPTHAGRNRGRVRNRSSKGVILVTRHSDGTETSEAMATGEATATSEAHAVSDSTTPDSPVR